MKKTYSITIEENEAGGYDMHRICDGFTALELLGILEFVQQEIIEQMNRNLKPDMIKREVVVDEDI